MRDPVNVLDHFKAESGSDITLKTLTLKLIILMALATMQRSQTLHFFEYYDNEYGSGLCGVHNE